MEIYLVGLSFRKNTIKSYNAMLNKEVAFHLYEAVDLVSINDNIIIITIIAFLFDFRKK